MVKRNASIENVELMDNVSPLWYWQAGRMYLSCVFKRPAEHLRKWGVGVCSVCFPWGIKKIMEIKTCVKSPCLIPRRPYSLSVSFSILRSPRAKIQTSLISIKANISVTGVIRTTQALSVSVSVILGLNTHPSTSQLQT